MCSRLLHSFKRCTVLHNAFPVCTTVYVFQANSTRTLALAPSRPLQNTSTHHAVSSWLLDPGRYAVHTKAYYNGRIWKWTSQDLFCTEDRSRIAPGGPPFLRSIIVETFGGNVALSHRNGYTPQEHNSPWSHRPCLKFLRTRFTIISNVPLTSKPTAAGTKYEKTCKHGWWNKFALNINYELAFYCLFFNPAGGWCHSFSRDSSLPGSTEL